MNSQTSNVNKVLLGLTVLLIIIISTLLYHQTKNKPDNYYGVMTTSGELFFGELHSFPSEYLTNVWTIQPDPEGKSNPVLVKFDRSIWGPEDRMDFNKKNIAWKAKLRADSQVVAQIKSSGTPSFPQTPQPPTPSPYKK